MQWRRTQFAEVTFSRPRSWASSAFVRSIRWHPDANVRKTRAPYRHRPRYALSTAGATRCYPHIPSSASWIDPAPHKRNEPNRRSRTRKAAVTVKAARRATRSNRDPHSGAVAALKAKAESVKADAGSLRSRPGDGEAGAGREGGRTEERGGGQVRTGEGGRRTSRGGVRQVAAGARVQAQRVTTRDDARTDVGDLRGGRRHRRRPMCGDPASVR